MKKITVSMVKDKTKLSEEDREEVMKSVSEVISKLDLDDKNQFSMEKLGLREDDETRYFLTGMGAVTMFIIKQLCTPAAYKIILSDINYL